MLLASDREMAAVLQAWVRWHRVGAGADPPLALDQLLNEGAAPLLVASPPGAAAVDLSGLIERLEMQDPRLVQTMSVISLFEHHQERLQLCWWFRSVVQQLPLGRPVQRAGSAQTSSRPAGGVCSAAAHSPFVGLAGL